MIEDIDRHPWRPWWAPVTLASIAAILLAVSTTVLAVTVGRDADEQTVRADIADCRAVLAARVTEAEGVSRSALNRLIIALATDDTAAVAAAVDDLTAADDVFRAVVAARDTYLAHPNGCPITADSSLSALTQETTS